MRSPIAKTLLALALSASSISAQAGVPNEKVRLGPKQEYFLIGAREDSVPSKGFGLILVLPGGPGSPDNNPRMRDMWESALPEGFLVAQLVAVQEGLGRLTVVWPTEKVRESRQNFSTESFIRRVVDDARQKYEIDTSRVYAMGWSSGGPAVYASALSEETPLKGAFILMSVFRPTNLPSLASAKGRKFYLMQSPEDTVTPFNFAETARSSLTDAGASVAFLSYPGGHAFPVNSDAAIRTAIEWLDGTASRKPVEWIADSTPRPVVQFIADNSKITGRASLADSIAALRPKSNSHPDVIAFATAVESLFYQRWFEALFPTDQMPLDSRRNSATTYEAEGAKLQLMRRANAFQSIVHCHPWQPVARGVPVNARLIGPHEVGIVAGVGRHAICPSWLLDRHALMGDERLNLDTAIVAELKTQVREERGAVLGQLDRAARFFPSDDWITGQRVRLTVEQRDTAAATRITESCLAARWWCGMLSGYVAHWRGNWMAAESLFIRAIAAAPATTRCSVLTDLAMLVSDSTRLWYQSLSCAGRDPINANIWWLSDPLYGQPGNERRAEHYARVVVALLHSALDTDGRYDWATVAGGSAVREMVVRYGWPAVAEWAGPVTDASHHQYLEEERPAHFTTSEYPLDRAHFVPASAAIRNPFTSMTDDWELSSIAAQRFQQRAKTWWPLEHMPVERGSVRQLFGDGQVAMFRRDVGALLAVTTELRGDDFRQPGGDSVHGQLIMTPNPEVFMLEPMRGRLGGLAHTQLFIESRPQLLGMEFAADATPLDVVRTRFSIQPPEPTTRLVAGAIAVSDLAFITPDAADAGRSADPRAALPRMLGTLRLQDVAGVSVYWETYGVRVGDTLDVALDVERLDRPSALRRLAARLGFGSNTESSVAIRWREPRSGDVAGTIQSKVPTLARITALNLSRLTPGHDRLSVSIKRPTGATAISRREFTIRERERP